MLPTDKKLTLRQARRMQDKTQHELAALLNIHVTTYRKIEGKPESATIEQAKKIAKFLRVPYDDIFFNN